VFFCRIEFLSYFLSFLCVIVVVCVEVVRHLARLLVHSRATFLPSSLLCSGFLVASTHSTLSSVLSVVRLLMLSFVSWVFVVASQLRFPPNPALRTQLCVFIFYKNGIPLGLSFVLSLSLSRSRWLSCPSLVRASSVSNFVLIF
jgi:hypothetical protein